MGLSPKGSHLDQEHKTSQLERAETLYLVPCARLGFVFYDRDALQQSIARQCMEGNWIRIGIIDSKASGCVQEGQRYHREKRRWNRLKEAV